RGKIEPTRHFGIFALYVSFFPQLVAGPIERAGHLIPQFKKMGKFEWSVLNESITRIFWGLFKKVVIADRLSLYVDAVYGNVSHHGSVSLILATYFFAIQIYCDFSAYSDIAIGSARLFGIRLRENFNNPYLATSITDFWRRWHISLSSWLRDYLYISLGGNRKSISRTYYNLIIVMLLGGLWHGAGWTFVFWGGLHGMYLIWERIIKNIKLKYFDVSTENNNNKGKKRMKNLTITWLKRIIVFHLVCLTWIFFRADTFNTAFEILIRIWKLIPGFFTDAIIFGHLITGMAISVVIISFSRWAKTRDNRHISEWYSIVSVGIIIVSIILLGVEQGSAFIYFQF
nr:MBOAT family protein [Bacteroidota bacterium]